MADTPRKSGLSRWIGGLVSLALVGWIVVFVDWHQVAAELARSNYLMLGPVFLVVVVHYLLRAWRWRYLLPERGEIAFSSLFEGIMVGNFASYFLPLRAGEFVRPFVFSRRGTHKFSSAFASVVIERFFDLSAVLISFVVVLQFVPGVPAVIHKGAFALLLLALCLLGFIIVGIFLPRRAHALIDFGMRFVPKRVRDGLRGFLFEFIDSTQVLRDPRRLTAVCLLTAGVWLSCYFWFQAFMWVVQISLPDASQYLIATTVAVIVALAVALPSSPGFLGVYQVGCVIGFGLFGISEGTAVAYALLSHVFQYLLFAAYGFYFLLNGDLTFSDLRSAVSNRKG
ncbi:MAG: flippase-like domain-containing protein [Oligoflexia bacterium]|nr:flippase-like domain-containing protein [Oligoflexia bacterium]